MYLANVIIDAMEIGEERRAAIRPMQRRQLVMSGVAWGLATCVAPAAIAQGLLQPFRLVIRREYSVNDLVGSDPSQCTYGRLWVVAPTRNVVTDPIQPQEKHACETMELPHRGNAPCISQIPKG